MIEQHLMQRLVSHRARRIELALRLLDDHLQLALELTRVDQRTAQRRALDLHRAAQSRRGKDHVVRGMVVGSVGIEVAAGRLGLARQLARAEPPARARRSGTLEVHVLQHVRDAHQLVRLVEETRLDPRDHGNCGGVGIALNQQREPVGEDFAPDVGGPSEVLGRRHA